MKLVVYLVILASIGSATILVLKPFPTGPCHSSGGCSASRVPGVDELHKLGLDGNPRNAIEDFRRIYPAMVEFRKTLKRWPTQDEIRGRLTNEDFDNPDAKELALKINGRAPRPGYMFAYIAPRADGTAKPLYPKPGERDVWFVSMHYTYYKNVKRDGRDHMTHAGVVVGLFSDGKIEVMPADKMLAVRRASNAYQSYFPTESGLPPDALTNDEMSWKVMLSNSNRKK